MNFLTILFQFKVVKLLHVLFWHPMIMLLLKNYTYNGQICVSYVSNAIRIIIVIVYTYCKGYCTNYFVWIHFSGIGGISLSVCKTNRAKSLAERGCLNKNIKMREWKWEWKQSCKLEPEAKNLIRKLNRRFTAWESTLVTTDISHQM